jgi:hypothetical protein
VSARAAAVLLLGAAAAGGCALGAPGHAGAAPRIELVDDAGAGALSFRIGGEEAFAYRYGPEWAIPHVWPLNAPSGRSLLVQRTEPFPHHRSLWIVDRVQLAGGPDTDYYHEWKNLVDPGDPAVGHHSFLRHDGFELLRESAGGAEAVARLSWIARGEPVLDQVLRLRLEPAGETLADGYLLHLDWSLTAAHGEVRFLSDWVHYAWPFLRMDPAYSGEQGGTIVDDQGRRGQEATNAQYAAWVDYSNTVDGRTEGLAVIPPADGRPRKWLTREYGTFGPRRPDEWSGTGFTLARGETLAGSVVIFVHPGDAAAAGVAGLAERLAAVPR